MVEASPGVAYRRRGWKSRETEGCPRHSLVLARTRPHSLPAGRGCCHGYGARALTLTNGWPRVSRTQRRFYICRDTHLSVRGREGKRGRRRRRRRLRGGGAREGETPTTTADDRLRLYTTSPPASGLLCYPDGIMPHSDCLLGNGSRTCAPARPVYAPLMNDASDSRDRRDIARLPSPGRCGSERFAR